MFSEVGAGASLRALRPVALACFLVSGACGLAYEIAWVRQLTLFAGATTPAVSTVLAVFMGGMALGAHWFGRWADRSPNPLRLYAWLELGIALYALLQPTLLDTAGAVYVGLARNSALQGMPLIGARLLMAAAVLSVPCMLMGGTLPVLARFLGRNGERFGFDLGTLYGINLGGAVLGSLLTGFELMPAFGLWGTIKVAACGSLLVALAAFLASARTPASRAAVEPTGTASTPHGAVSPRQPYALLWGLCGLSGFATMAYQVTWTRMLSFGFDSTVYSFTIILVTFLTGLSVGSLVFARLDRQAPRLRLLLWAHVFGGLTALLSTPLAAYQPALLGFLTEQFGFTGTVQLAGMGLGAVAVMLVPTTLMGIVFPLVSRLLVDDPGQVGRRLGRAYLVNTLGAIAGSLLTAFVLIPTWSLKGCMLALAATQAAGGLLLLPWSGMGRRVQIGVAVAAGAGLAAAGGLFESLLPGPSPFDEIVFGRRQPAKLLAHRDDVTASVSVVEAENGSRALRINGFETAADDEGSAYMPMMSHLPMLLHPNPRNVLVICFGTGSTAGAALFYPEAHVDVVDINSGVFAFAPYFERTNHGVHKDSRARLIVDDGRNFLLTTGDTYDVITSEPMPPKHAGVVNLYSREYYELARRRLAPGGFLVQWLPFHLVAKQEAVDILQTVRSVFPETTLWMHAHTGLIVARADGQVRLDLARLQRAWRDGALAQELARLGLPTIQDLTQTYLLGSRTVERLAAAGRVISDDRPTLEFHPPRHRSLQRMGFYTEDSAAVLDTIYALRAEESFPLDGLTPDVAPLVEAMFDVQSVILRGDLWMDLDRPRRAREAYESGLQLVPSARPMLLTAMAWAERAGGNEDEARRLLAESLALQPDNERARSMLREMDTGTD